jgi:Tol biopolymer transport system component
MLSGCRGEVDTFEPPDLVRGETGRLTFNAGDDRSPAWMPSGDAILYHTNGLVGVDSGPGVLILVSVENGSARAALPAIQSPEVVGTHWLLAPTPRPDGAAVAFAEIRATWPAHPCEVNLVVRLVCTPARAPAEAEQPPLQLVAIHAR